MPDIRDFLPQPPWEGPPIPRYLSDQEPPTPRQLRYIAILCQKLGIKEPLEEQVRTRGEAGRLIRELEAEEKHRKGLKGGNPITWRDVQIGDIVNIKTFMPRRANLVRVEVIAKYDTPGHEGLRVENSQGGRVYVPAPTITKVEVI